MISFINALTWWQILLCMGVLFLCRIAWVLRQIQQRRRSKSGIQPSRTKPVKTLLILGSGGHTTELLYLTRHLDPQWYHPIWYVKAQTDTTSVMRLPPGTPPESIYTIPRAREVGQSYISSIFTTLYAQLYAVVLLLRLRPDLIVCNGPGTCVPLCVAAALVRLVGLAPAYVVFCESYCRVTTLSVTGRILYPWADVFLVHWPTLHERYPDSILSTAFVRHSSPSETTTVSTSSS
jgi:beta-1,4-N-acetylglucosaminyltransferase